MSGPPSPDITFAEPSPLSHNMSGPPSPDITFAEPSPLSHETLKISEPRKISGPSPRYSLSLRYHICRTVPTVPLTVPQISHLQNRPHCRSEFRDRVDAHSFFGSLRREQILTAINARYTLLLQTLTEYHKSVEQHGTDTDPTSALLHKLRFMLQRDTPYAGLMRDTFRQIVSDNLKQKLGLENGRMDG
jgi:hypothetical protein